MQHKDEDKVFSTPKAVRMLNVYVCVCVCVCGGGGGGGQGDRDQTRLIIIIQFEHKTAVDLCTM